MAYYSNIDGTTSYSFKIGDVTIIHAGDVVKIVYPDLTEFIIADSTPPSGASAGDPVAVEGLYSSPPGGYANGQRFAITLTPTGEFAGHPGAVAFRDSGVWDFVDPVDGWVIYDKSEGRTLAYDPTLGWRSWTLSPSDVRQAVEDATDSNVFTDSEKTKLAGIEAGATADLTAAEILALLRTVDGVGSLLDADLLDGQSGPYYLDLANATGTLPAGSFGAGVHGNLPGGSLHSIATQSVAGFMSAADKAKLDGIEDSATGDLTAAEVRSLVDAALDSNVFTDSEKTKLAGIEAGATADLTAAEILAALLTVDGPGSGLDADRLDGQSSAYYAPAASPTFTGTLTAADATITGAMTVDGEVSLLDPIISINHELAAAPQMGLSASRGLSSPAQILWDEALGYWVAGLGSSLSRIWTAGGDGTGSGLDADLLDGQHGPYYLDLANAIGTLAGARFTDSSHGSRGGGSLHSVATTSSAGFMSAVDKAKIDGIASGANNYVLPGTVVHRDSAADISGTWELQDDVQLRLGSLSNSALLFDDSANELVIEGITPSTKVRVRGRSALSALRTLATFDPDAGVTLTHAGDVRVTTTSAGMTVTGNVTVTGTVDGYDVSTMGEKLAGIEAGATADLTALEVLNLVKTVDGTGSGLDADRLDGQDSTYFAPIDSPNLIGTPTAPTAAQGTNTSQLATTAFVSSAVGISMQEARVRGRAVGAGTGAAQDLTAAQLITVLTTADGAGSDLDADTLDGQHGSFYRDAGNLNAGTIGAARFTDSSHGTRAGGSLHSLATTLAAGFMSAADKAKLDGIEAGAGGDMSAAEILAALLTVDGSGSGLDADLFDGYTSSNFALLSGATFTASASNSTYDGSFNVALSNTNAAGGNRAALLLRTGDTDSSLQSRVAITATKGTADGTGRLSIMSRQNDASWLETVSVSEAGLLATALGMSAPVGSVGSPSFRFTGAGTTGIYHSSGIAFSVSGTQRARVTSAGILTPTPGSGALLDVDASSTVPSLVPDSTDTDTGIGTSAPDVLELVAGGVSALTLTEIGGAISAVVHGDLTVQGTTFTIDSTTVNVTDNYLVLNSDASGVPTDDSGIEIERGSSTNAVIHWDETLDEWRAGLIGTTHRIWHSGNDGAGSTLDADTLDTYEATAFPRKAENATIAGSWAFDAPFQLPIGSSSAPSIFFAGTTNAGIYSPAAGRVGITSGGTLRFNVDTALYANDAAGPQLVNAPASGTVPTLVPNRASTTTGIGAQASGNLSAIVSGTEVVRVTSAGLNVLTGDIVLGGVTFSPRATVTLNDNTSTPTAAYTFTHASTRIVVIDYHLTRGSSMEYGTIVVGTDGTSIDRTQTFGSIGTAAGVSFTVDVSGANGRLLYTTTSTGSAATMAYSVRRFG